MINKAIKLIGVSFVVSALYVGASSANPTTALDKVYLKAGAGIMNFDKFKETDSKKGNVSVNTVGYVKKTPKTPPMCSIGIGYKFTNALRVDLNLLYAKIKYRANLPHRTIKQNIKTLAAFSNGYFDISFDKSNIIVPYVTVGIGVGNNNADALKPRDFKKRRGKSKTTFIWNAGAGVKCNINENFAVDLGYRYMDFGKIKTDGSISEFSEAGDQKLRGHQFLGALIYNF